MRNPDVSTYAGQLEPWQYTEKGDFSAGGGGWVISIVELVRIVSSMDPNAVRPSLLTPNQVMDLMSPYKLRVGLSQVIDIPSARCFGLDTLSANASPFPGIAVNRLTHNGQVDGGAGLLIHMMESGTTTPSVTIGLALNMNVNLGDAEIADLTGLARFHESNGLWTADDYFEIL